MLVVAMTIIEVTMINDGGDDHIGKAQVHCAATWCQSRKLVITMMMIYVIIVDIIIILMVMIKMLGGRHKVHCAATWCQSRKPIIRNNHDDGHDYK